MLCSRAAYDPVLCSSAANGLIICSRAANGLMLCSRAAYDPILRSSAAKCLMLWSRAAYGPMVCSQALDQTRPVEQWSTIGSSSTVAPEVSPQRLKVYTGRAGCQADIKQVAYPVRNRISVHWYK